MTQSKLKEERNEVSYSEAQEITPKPHPSYWAIAMGQAGMSRERALATLIENKKNNPDTRE